MGVFSQDKTSTKAVTTNQQIGIQQARDVATQSIVGRVSGNVAGQGATLLAPRLGKGAHSVINITTTTTDKEAFSTIGQIATNSQSLASEAINASHQIAINSLQSAQSANETAARLAELSVGGAIQVAGMAAPVSEGNLALAANKKQLIIAVIVVIAIAGAIYYRKKIMP